MILSRVTGVLLANTLNLLIAIYLSVLVAISLIKLRWYHQITLAVYSDNIAALTLSSYEGFVIPLIIALLLIVSYIINSFTLSKRVYLSPKSNLFDGNRLNYITNYTTNEVEVPGNNDPELRAVTPIQMNEDARGIANTRDIQSNNDSRRVVNQSSEHDASTPNVIISESRVDDEIGLSEPLHGLMIEEQPSLPDRNYLQSYCFVLGYFLIAILSSLNLTIWLMSRGELIRYSISGQLERAYSLYQFTNRTSNLAIIIDAMQDINSCCGIFDYTDFPYSGSTGLPYGNYPGSCCGKNILGSNARVICKPEEVVLMQQTLGCYTVISGYYDIISLLMVPASCISLLVQVYLIVVITLSNSKEILSKPRDRDPYRLYS